MEDPLNINTFSPGSPRRVPALRPVPSLDRPGELPAVEGLMRRLCRAEGWLGHIAEEHLSGGGKRVRARLALAAAEGLGLDPLRAAPVAAAAELLHNATLLHDDIQDGDDTRRGRPATWVIHGVPQAINAGDLMLMLPTAAAEHLDCSDGTRWQVARAISARARACVVGQSLELELTRRGHTDRQRWREAARGKTGELLALPVQGAALLAGWGADRAAALGDAFRNIGLLYQLRDDLVDLYGDKGRDRPGNDLREGKISCLVVEHLRLRPADRGWLLGVLRAARENTDDADVLSAALRFQESGAVRAVVGHMQELADRVAADRALRDQPALRGLAVGLALMLLRPIGSIELARDP